MLWHLNLICPCLTAIHTSIGLKYWGVVLSIKKLASNGWVVVSCPLNQVPLFCVSSFRFCSIHLVGWRLLPRFLPWCFCIPLVISREVIPTCKVSYSGCFGNLRAPWLFPQFGVTWKSRVFGCIYHFLVVFSIASYQLAHNILSLFLDIGCLFDWFWFCAISPQVNKMLTLNQVP